MVILEEELLDMVVEELTVRSVDPLLRVIPPTLCSSAAIPFNPWKPTPPASPCRVNTLLVEYDCCVTLLAVLTEVDVVVPALVVSSSFNITVTGFGSWGLALARFSVDLARPEMP